MPNALPPTSGAREINRYTQCIPALIGLYPFRLIPFCLYYNKWCRLDPAWGLESLGCADCIRSYWPVKQLTPKINNHYSETAQCHYTVLHVYV